MQGHRALLLSLIDAVSLVFVELFSAERLVSPGHIVLLVERLALHLEAGQIHRPFANRAVDIGLLLPRSRNLLRPQNRRLLLRRLCAGR